MMDPTTPIGIKVTLYRYHPQNKHDAEDIESNDMNPATKHELADMRAGGAKFYWSDFGHTGEFVRCEYANIKFVLDVMGATIEINDQLT